MAAKTKTSTTSRTNGSSETLESMVSAGSDAMKQSFERAVQGYDQLAAFNKATVEALIQATNAATKGFETINSEALAFSRQTIEESVAVAKAAIGSKSIQELIELQSDFTKSTFDSYVGQMTKMGDMVASIAKEAAEPLNSRVAALVEMVQGARAA
jgi:phasin family protein